MEFIYIPLWLDLLLLYPEMVYGMKMDLHSTMVRFIIILLNYCYQEEYDLHSTMVRFIINEKDPIAELKKRIYIPLWLDLLFNSDNKQGDLNIAFTFHYG